MTDKREIGRAYAFFDCQASRAQIEAEMPNLRHDAQTPSEMELRLFEDVTSIQDDEEIEAIARQANNEGLRYAIKATLPGANNRKTAGELADVVNAAYMSPLFQRGKFIRTIFYEEGGEYLEKE